MVEKVIRFVTSGISSLHKAAFWLALFSIFSQILAFLRDRLLAYYFGAGHELDIYYTAFRIPDLIFVTIGSLVSVSVLIPMFSKKALSHKDDFNLYSNSIFTAFFVLISFVSILAFFFMPYLVNFFGGFDRESLSEIIKFSRILLLSPILLGMSNFFGSIVQYEKRFFLYSISPLFYNFGILFGIIFGAKSFGITAVVCGVILGAFLHFLVPFFYTLYFSKIPKFIFNLNLKEVFDTALISIPRAITLSFTQIITVFFTSIASFLGSGSVAIFSFAFNLQSVPLAIIGVSYSLATFPDISDSYTKNNYKDCAKYISESLRYIIFWTLPLTALFIVLRSHIVRVILGSGAFDWSDTRLTSAMLSLFAISFVFQSIQLFLTRTYYATGLTKKPLLWTFFGVLITIVLTTLFYSGVITLPLIWLQKSLEIPILHSSSIIILPITFALGSIVTVLGLWFSLKKDLRGVVQVGLYKSIWHSILSSSVIFLSTFYSLRIFDQYFILDYLLGVFGHAFISGIIGIICGIIVLKLLKNIELNAILSKILRKL